MYVILKKHICQKVFRRETIRIIGGFSIMKKKTTWIFVLSAMAFLIICGVLVFFTNFAVVNGNLYSLSVSTMDLKDTGIDSISVLNRFAKLESADVSGNKIKSLPALKNCTSLRLLSVSGSDFPAQECVDFYDAHPGARLECGVLIGDTRFSSLAESVTLSDGMNDGDIRSLAALKNVEILDLSGSEVNDETYDYLKEKLPGWGSFSYARHEHCLTGLTTLLFYSAVSNDYTILYRIRNDIFSLSQLVPKISNLPI